MSDVDAKAEWLATNPNGLNYDISQFDAILPLAVTPFAELIHLSEPRFWLTETIPRVLTPFELREYLEDGTIESAIQNCSRVVKIPRPM